MDFQIGSSFPSWDSFSDAFEVYKRETHQPLIISSKRTTAVANRRIFSSFFMRRPTTQTHDCTFINLLKIK